MTHISWTLLNWCLPSAGVLRAGRRLLSHVLIHLLVVFIVSGPGVIAGGGVVSGFVLWPHILHGTQLFSQGRQILPNTAVTAHQDQWDSPSHTHTCSGAGYLRVGGPVAGFGGAAAIGEGLWTRRHGGRLLLHDGSLRRPLHVPPVTLIHLHTHAPHQQLSHHHSAHAQHSQQHDLKDDAWCTRFMFHICSSPAEKPYMVQL